MKPALITHEISSRHDVPAGHPNGRNAMRQFSNILVMAISHGNELPRQ